MHPIHKGFDMLLMSKVKNDCLIVCGDASDKSTVMVERQTRINGEKATIKVPKSYKIQFVNYEHVFDHKDDNHKHLSEKEFKDMEKALYASSGWNAHYGEPAKINIDESLPNVASLNKKQMDIIKAQLESAESEQVAGLTSENQKLKELLEKSGVKVPDETSDFESLAPSLKLKARLAETNPDIADSLYESISAKHAPGIWNKMNKMDESQIDAFIEENK